MPFGLVRVIRSLRQFMTMIGAVRHVDRMIVTHCTLALQELANNPLTILDKSKTLYQIIIVTRRCVLKTADTAIQTRRHGQHAKAVCRLDLLYTLRIDRGNHVDTAGEQRVKTCIRIGDRCDLDAIEMLTGVPPIVRVTRMG